MKILITNEHLQAQGGTQAVARDLATEFQRQGHIPLVYSPALGVTAREIAARGIEVTDNLSSLSVVPDVIHGQHHAPVVDALLCFPSAPAVYVCHGVSAGQEEPFYFPRILRYVAVDERRKARIEKTPGIPSNRIDVIPNAVDLARFRGRGPLPVQPKRALVFSNYASPSTQLPAVRTACRKLGLPVEVVGYMAGSAVTNPEEILPQYDLVFARGRCALEALAVGCAVVLCDFEGVGAMVTSRNLDALRSMNFGAIALTQPLRAKFIEAEARRYDANDAGTVCDRVRAEAGLAKAAERWLELYRGVRQEFEQTPRDYPGELIALASYFKRWSYRNRVEWEREQFEKLSRVPVIGNALLTIARRVVRKWTGNYGLS